MTVEQRLDGVRELDRQIKESGSKQEHAWGLGGGKGQLGRSQGCEGVGRSSRRGRRGGRGRSHRAISERKSDMM